MHLVIVTVYPSYVGGLTPNSLHLHCGQHCNVDQPFGGKSKGSWIPSEEYGRVS